MPLQERSSSAALSSADSRPSVLLVERYDDVRKLLDVLLRHAGYRVTSIVDGEEAIVEMDSGQYACVIVGSPVLVRRSGQDTLLLDYIDQQRPLWSASVIVLTAWVEDRALLTAAARSGVCAVFAKPFSPLEFLPVVADCVEGRVPQRRWFGVHQVASASSEDA